MVGWEWEAFGTEKRMSGSNPSDSTAGGGGIVAARRNWTRLANSHCCGTSKSRRF